VALKTQSLEPLGDRADAFVDALIAEGESTRDLASQNIVLLYGAGEIDGQFCAAMEYIQGNSVATMLARKEGFSIWDLLDITRRFAPVWSRLHEGCGSPFIGTGQDHGAVGRDGQNPRLWHLQHEPDCSGLGKGLAGSCPTVLRNKSAEKPPSRRESPLG